MMFLSHSLKDSNEQTGGNILESVKDPKKKKQSFRVFLMDPWSVTDNAFSFVVHIWGLCCDKTSEHSSDSSSSFPAVIL